jgi:uncharacterized protein (TIGR04255 family)
VTLPAIFEAPDETPLARSPIVTVIWQLRFEDHPTMASPQSALVLQKILGGPSEYSLVQIPRIQVSLQPVGPGSAMSQPPSVGATSAGWRLSANDSSCQISIESSSVSIEAAQYGSWASDFSPRLLALLHAIEEVGPPVIETRLGLRYVNVVVGSAAVGPPFNSATELAKVVAPWLLGPLTQEDLREHVQITQGRVSFKFDQSDAILNHGVVSAENGELGYLIDVDAFREGGRAFNVSEVVDQSALLHKIVLGLFQASLTPDALLSMRSPESTAQ